MSPPILLRCFVMLPSRNTPALLVNNIKFHPYYLTLNSLPVQFKHLPSLHKSSSEIQTPTHPPIPVCVCLSLPPYFSICIMSAFYGIYADNRIMYFSLSYTETATVLRNLYTFNKPLLPNLLQTTRHTISHLFILVEKAEDLTIHIP